jgi:hypothetical protein
VVTVERLLGSNEFGEFCGLALFVLAAISLSLFSFRE